MIDDGESFGETRDSSSLFDDTVVTLSQDQLRQVCCRSVSGPTTTGLTDDVTSRYNALQYEYIVLVDRH